MDLKKAVLRTLTYSDIFDYPLTVDELWKYLMIETQSSKFKTQNHISKLKSLETLITTAQSVAIYKNGYFCLNGREEIISIRKKKQKDNKEKKAFAEQVARYLGKVPTVLFIGISGGVAMENAEKEDDIDLFVITAKNTLWTTRLLLTLLLDVRGLRRKRHTSDVSNKICLNFLIDESAIAFPKLQQDLYTAHEIVQLIPLISKHNMYEQFLVANKWILQYMSNSFNNQANPLRPWSRTRSFLFIYPLEMLLKHFQRMYMRKHITSETIGQNLLAFHPVDYRGKVLKEYKRRLAR